MLREVTAPDSDALHAGLGQMDFYGCRIFHIYSLLSKYRERTGTFWCRFRIGFLILSHYRLVVRAGILSVLRQMHLSKLSTMHLSPRPEASITERSEASQRGKR